MSSDRDAVQLAHELIALQQIPAVERETRHRRRLRQFYRRLHLVDYPAFCREYVRLSRQQAP